MSDFAVCPFHHAHPIVKDYSGFEKYGFFVGNIGSCPCNNYRLDANFAPLQIIRRDVGPVLEADPTPALGYPFVKGLPVAYTTESVAT